MMTNCIINAYWLNNVKIKFGIAVSDLSIILQAFASFGLKAKIRSVVVSILQV